MAGEQSDALNWLMTVRPELDRLVRDLPAPARPVPVPEPSSPWQPFTVEERTVARRSGWDD